MQRAGKYWGFPGGGSGTEPVNARDLRDTGSIPGSERSPGEGNGSPLQYSCLENPMDRGAWWTMVHRVTKSWTQLNDFAQGNIEKQMEYLVCVTVSVSWLKTIFL